MKSIILLLLCFPLFFSVKAQKSSLPISIPDLKTSSCLTIQEPDKINATTNTDIKKSDSLELVFTIQKPAQAKESEKLYLLKNLASQKYFTGKKIDGKLLFQLGRPLQGVDSAIFQLVNINKKTCYQVVIQVEAKEETEPEKVNLPPLNLTSYTLNVDPCASSASEGNKIIYDFKKNSLKNLKVGSTYKDKKTSEFEEKHLKWRWTRLPRVKEEMVFEIHNVNPFKYDITLTDEIVIINTEAPSSLTEAFTLRGGISASSGTGTKGTTKEEKAILEEALKNLDKALSSKLVELRNAGDFFNPCSYVKSAVDDVHTYFGKLPKISYTSNTITLEEFLTAKIKEYFTDADDEKKVKELYAIVAKFYTFRNSATGTFNYPILQIKNVDQYLFKLNLTPKPNILTGARVLNQEVAVDVLGGFKVDVSSGLFLTSLVDENYRLRADSTVIKTKSGFTDSIVYNRRNKIIPDMGNKNDFGVTSLFHFYPKVTPNINLAFSLGAGVTLNQKPKLRYLTGFSLLVGKTNRLALTYGLALGYVDRLSDIHINQQDISGDIYTSIKDKKVELKKQFETKSFISLTYSIPLIKKTEVVKPAPVAEPEKDKEEPKEEEPKKVDDKKEPAKP